jgi:hypothetical protein
MTTFDKLTPERRELLRQINEELATYGRVGNATISVMLDELALMASNNTERNFCNELRQIFAESDATPAA